MQWIKEKDFLALMSFLPCATSIEWVKAALDNEEILLVNHCYLEQCAARNAMRLMFRCPNQPELLSKMSKLAREELHHFDQVYKILKKRGYTYRILKPSRYASRLNKAIRKIEDGTYGYCEETNQPISLKRLIARPIATLSLEAQESHEKSEKVYKEKEY